MRLPSLHNGLRLRVGAETDIPWFRSVELDPANQHAIGSFTFEEHLRNLRDPDCIYVVLETADGASVAFAILRGAAAPGGVIELKRIVTTAPGHGYGRTLLQALMHLVFVERGDRRIWLSVIHTNETAIRLYRLLNFVREGELREHYITPDGLICNIDVYGMLRSEFTNISKGK